MARSAIPILPSADLEGTETFYAQLGFQVAGRYDGYLVLHQGPVELHFSAPPSAQRPSDATDEPAGGPAGGRAGEPVPGTCFVHVQDAVRYWKQLRERKVAGVRAPEQRAYGLVEFVVTDPFGNRVRFGSPAR
jgi:catechol 2,3-dioxygenase-like lactoylglutathione lyase family enzyme